jgi:natural product biosynthesis luciferase-like monooxygenase protein
MTRKSAFIIGEAALTIQCAANWLDRGHRLSGVATTVPEVAAWARGRDVPVFIPTSPDLPRALSAARPDYLFSIVYLQMLPEAIIGAPLRAAINFHDGPLPRYAGLNVTSWAILEGETQHGVSWHEMTTRADAGQIFVQQAVDIDPGATAFELNAACFAAGIDSFATLCERIEAGPLAGQLQDETARSYFGRLDRPADNALLPFSEGNEAVTRLVRALDYGTVPNPLAVPKLTLPDGRVITVRRAAIVSEEGRGDAPGALLATSPDGWEVATADGAVRLSDLRLGCGAPIDPVTFPADAGLTPGTRLGGAPDEDEARARLRVLGRRAARAEDRVARALNAWSPFRLPAQGRDGAGPGEPSAAAEPAPIVHIEVPAALQTRASEAALLFLARLAAGAPVSVGVSSAAEREAVSGVEALFAATAPLRLACDPADTASAALVAASAALEDARRATPWAIDLLQRDGAWAGVPRTAGGLVFPVIIARDRRPDDGPAPPAEELVLSVAPGGATIAIEATSALDPAAPRSLGRQLEAFLGALRADSSRPFSSLPLADGRDLAELATWNDTARPFPHDACLHELIAEQAARTPDAVALRSGGQTLTYAQLDRRANALAHVLRGAGAGPDRLVGLYLERSLELVVGALGVWKAGAAYVPLDPSYPRDRLAYMIEDAEIETVLAQPALAGAVPSERPRVVPLSLATIGESPTPPQTPVQSRDLAYVIYTSGSTGRPKGVMVEHRNVANFFVGMDERLGFEPGRDQPGVWLAVTSLSFDISVLELFWTLARGFEVVLHRSGEAQAGASARALENADQDIDFGLFYFSSDESATGAGGKYRLLLEGARFADAHGFNSVWTPERHFHAFGGLYPNPSVTSAAVATITRHVQLRAGSCVSPLHHPVRVAEEWSVVDNLSNGRVGLAFAAGWQPNDFLLNPPRYPDRKNEMLRDIETVRRLWRGETVTFPGPTGEPVEVRTLPRPIQAELPYWVTAAGNPETFAAAGRLGANLLTHLLGQSVAEVTQKVRIYREARREAGHEGPGVVSLMLHTFVGHSEEAVRETVREPMKQYLSSAVGLVKAAAWQFPTFKATTTMADGSFGIDHLSAEEMDALLDHAFRRYYDTSGLFGTVDQCVAIVDGLKACGVDEIACLIDFGVPTQAVIDQLPLLAQVLRRSKPALTRLASGTDTEPAAPAPPETVGALIARHGVSHLQCTPSMAQMLVVDEAVRASLAGLSKLMVGGEAFPPPLARDLERLVRGDVINMYGPTETTIWSTTHPVRGVGDDVPIGRPIANTDLLVLDALQQPVPNGGLGELCIGGAGVVRGYLGRPELTAERFVRHPLRPEERIYRTGDLARFRSDGIVEFRGRLDHQVKLRGYRIELGEIEAVIGEHEAVREVAVVLREDTPGARRLVAYVITRDGEPAPAEALRDHVQQRLPEYMVPSLFVGLERFPRTPNQKIDRNAFPVPEGVASAAATREHVAPAEGLESVIASIWRDVLGLARVGVADNFFDLGGHSLLTIEVHRRLREAVERPVTLIDLFRFPTIRSLSGYLESADGGAKAAEAGAERAQARRDAMARRQNLAAARRRR